MAFARISSGSVGRRAALQLPLAALAASLLPRPAASSLPDDHQLLGILGNLVIPPTTTPGAGDTATVDFVAKALAHGMDHAPPDIMATLRGALDTRAGGDFANAPAATQLNALTALDAASYGEQTPQTAAWRKVKGLILAGYYTSEAGCTRELVYDLAPGRWDYDIPLTPETRACANDWFAVSFR